MSSVFWNQNAFQKEPFERYFCSKIGGDCGLIAGSKALLSSNLWPVPFFKYQWPAAGLFHGVAL